MNKQRARNWGLVAAIGATLLAICYLTARSLGFNGLIISNSGIAFNQTFSFNLVNDNVNTVSASAVYSSQTFVASNFTTGQTSTGSIAIANNSLLSTAAATDSIVITSTAGEINDNVVITNPSGPGAFVFRQGVDWLYGVNTTSAAISLAAAIRNVPFLSVSQVGNVIYTTAPVGAAYNSVLVHTNSTDTISISTPTMLGGQDPAVVSVNGTSLGANRQFAVGASSDATATNLAAAINAASPLNQWVSATANGNSVSLVSLAAGSLYNFGLSQNANGAFSLSNPVMNGGITPSYSLNGSIINVPAHGLTLALPVLFSTNSSPAISGLANGTTYYVIPVDANDIELASTSTGAQAGNPIILASSSTLSIADSYTLTPLPFVAGSAGFYWEVSNDGINWTALNVASVTYTSPGTTSWNLGTINYKYLGLNVTAPTSGGLNLQVTALGTYQF